MNFQVIFPQTNSIVNFLKGQEKPSDFESRKALAKENGIEDYKGLAEQNLKLLEILRSADGVEEKTDHVYVELGEKKEFNCNGKKFMVTVREVQQGSA